MLKHILSKFFFFVPVWILRIFIRKKPTVFRGQVFDLQSSVFLDVQPASVLHKLPDRAIPKLREVIGASKINSRLSRKHSNAVENKDHFIDCIIDDQVLLREYIPNKTDLDTAVLFIHGGGFVIDSVDVYDDMVSYFAGHLGTSIFSLEYVLSPEYKYPVAVNQAEIAFKWICENKADKISVCGDSAGAYIGACLTQMLADKGSVKPHSQLLIYPTCGPNCGFESMDLFADGFYLLKKDFQWFWGHFINDEDSRQDGYLNLLDGSYRKNLPKTMIVTAGFDPIVDEGKQYAKMIKQAGGDVIHFNYPTLFHGFAFMTKLKTAGIAVSHFLDAYKKILQE